MFQAGVASRHLAIQEEVGCPSSEPEFSSGSVVPSHSMASTNLEASDRLRVKMQATLVDPGDCMQPMCNMTGESNRIRNDLTTDANRLKLEILKLCFEDAQEGEIPRHMPGCWAEHAGQASRPDSTPSLHLQGQRGHFRRDSFVLLRHKASTEVPTLRHADPHKLTDTPSSRRFGMMWLFIALVTSAFGLVHTMNSFVPNLRMLGFVAPQFMHLALVEQEAQNVVNVSWQGEVRSSHEACLRAHTVWCRLLPLWSMMLECQLFRSQIRSVPFPLQDVRN